MDEKFVLESILNKVGRVLMQMTRVFEAKDLRIIHLFASCLSL